MKRIAMEGRTYGRLLILEELPNRKVFAGCACGNEGVFLRGNILAGYTQSCGCLQKDRTSDTNLTHGHRKSLTPTYISWRNMKARCDNSSHEHFHRYGGRGITYCSSWAFFENFLKDMGERPEGKELDRIDNGGNYEPENCRWITHRENVRNKG
jgi:hypothetical protein